MKIMTFCVLIGVTSTFILSGCAAPVKITGYPNELANEKPKELCETEYTSVQVLGSLPTNREYEEVGYMVLEQNSSSEYVYTSEEKQILEARKRACEWGADAIVVMAGHSEKGSDFWTGYHDQRSNRVIAIIFK